MSYLIVIATFILCWSELWHFDFQVNTSYLRSITVIITEDFSLFLSVASYRIPVNTALIELEKFLSIQFNLILI